MTWRNYIRQGKLWQAFAAPARVVLLIDEIDKADIEFPNDLLQELDRMEFHVYETGETVRALHRPVVIITSNNEKELPDAFLRRCFFHYIRFPEPDVLAAIVQVHFPDIKPALLTTALTQFFEIRETPGLKKKPSTSRGAGLAEAAAGRGSRPRGSEARRQACPAQAAWRAVEERAGRASVRAAGLHGARASARQNPRIGRFCLGLATVLPQSGNGNAKFCNLLKYSVITPWQIWRFRRGNHPWVDLAINPENPKD